MTVQRARTLPWGDDITGIAKCFRPKKRTDAGSIALEFIALCEMFELLTIVTAGIDLAKNVFAVQASTPRHSPISPRSRTTDFVAQRLSPAFLSEPRDVMRLTDTDARSRLLRVEREVMLSPVMTERSKMPDL